MNVNIVMYLSLDQVPFSLTTVHVHSMHGVLQVGYVTTVCATQDAAA